MRTSKLIYLNENAFIRSTVVTEVIDPNFYPSYAIQVIEEASKTKSSKFSYPMDTFDLGFLTEIFKKITEFLSSEKDAKDFAKREKERLKRLEAFLKKNKIDTKKLKSKLKKKGNLLNTDAKSFAFFVSEIIHDLTSARLSDLPKNVVKVLVILILNDAAFLLIAGILGLPLNHPLVLTLTAIFIAPLTEEAYKAAGLKRGTIGSDLLIFNILEFSLYLLRYTASIGFWQMAIVRVIAVIAHYLFALFHYKGHYEDLLNKKYKFDPDRNFSKEALSAARVAHGVWNFGLLGINYIVALVYKNYKDKKHAEENYK